MSGDWYVYMVRCRDGTLYTGIAKDVKRRVQEHNHHRRGARYTRARRPVDLVYCESQPSRSAAARREYRLRSLRADAKRALAAQYQYG